MFHLQVKEIERSAETSGNIELLRRQQVRLRTKRHDTSVCMWLAKSLSGKTSEILQVLPDDPV